MRSYGHLAIKISAPLLNKQIIWSPCYQNLTSSAQQADPIWWWKSIWRTKCQHKAKLFMGWVLTNKIPIWDKMKKIAIKLGIK